MSEEGEVNPEIYDSFFKRMNDPNLCHIPDYAISILNLKLDLI